MTTTYTSGVPVRQTGPFISFAATAFVFLVGLNLQVVGSITTALIGSALLMPMVVTEFARHRILRATALLSIFGLIAALLLYVASPETHSFGTAASVTAWFVGSVLSIGTVAWASRHISLQSVLLSFALGWVTQVLIQHEQHQANLWKYGLSQPLTIALLAAVGQRSFAARTVAVLALSAFGFVMESRSYGAICLVAFIISEIVRRGFDRHRPIAIRRSRALMLCATALLAVWAISTAVVALLTSGFFGEDIRARTMRQEIAPGGLILNGRPEWAASLGLLLPRPLGYGAGAVPEGHDVQLAMQGLANNGLSTAGSYYHEYMFAGEFRLHSIIADLWLNFSLPGLLLALLIAALASLLLIGALGPSGNSTGAVAFLALSSLWYLLFGPFYSNLPQVAFTLAVATVISSQRAERGNARPSPILE